uniref:Uncharacterized protein n=1 Tax=Aegilops tauschii TaxID=37682 RepID=M8CZ03_AEGTA
MDLRAENMQGDMYEGKKPEQRLDKSQCWNFFGRCGNLGKGVAIVNAFMYMIGIGRLWYN